MKYTIYHNPRCRKSREALQLLQERQLEVEVVKYLEQPFDKNSLGAVLQKIKMQPAALIRKNEQIWKKEFASQNLDPNQLIEIMVAHPQLIERPIVTAHNSGVLARPLEQLINFLVSS